MNWRSGPEIDAHIDRMIFEVQLKRYDWKKTFSVKPRLCYWTGVIIAPLTYAMVAHYRGRRSKTSIIVGKKEDFPLRWISMSAYVYLRLLGKID